MVKLEIKVINKLGLHTRAAARLVHEASRYHSTLTIHRGEQSADAKSIMGLMMLAASQGTLLELRAEGRDEKKAAASVSKLFATRFDEDE